MCAGMDLAGYADHRKELSGARLGRGWSRPAPQTIGSGRLKLKIGTKSDKGSTLSDILSRTRCANCGRKGHWWKDCTYPPDERARNRNKTGQSRQNLTASEPSEPVSNANTVTNGFFFGSNPVAKS